MDHVRENDPVLFRDENSDDFAVEYYVSTDVSKPIKAVIGDTVYKEFLLTSEMLKTINSDKDVKGTMFSCIIRVRSYARKLSE